MARSAALGFVCFFLLFAAAAQANRRSSEDGASSTERIIDLTDGSIYRGELIEYVPKDHLTLRLPTGEIRSFAWAGIKRVAVVASTGKLVPLPKREPKPAALPPPPSEQLAAPPIPPAPPVQEPPPVPVAAQTVPIDDNYRDQLATADDFYRDRDYSRALAIYQQLYRSYGVPSLVYHVGRMQQKLGDFRAAYDSFGRYLAENPSADPNRRTQAQDHLERCRRAIQAIDALPSEIRQRSELSFVTVEANTNRYRLQMLTDTLNVEGWSLWAGPIIDGTAQKWKTLCKNDCETAAPPKAVLRIVGPDIRSSSDFELPRRSHDIRLKVQAASNGSRVAAWVMLATGLLSAGIAAGVGLTAQEPDTIGMTGNLASTTRGVAIGMGVLGAALTIGSIPVFAVSRTRVSVEY